MLPIVKRADARIHPNGLMADEHPASERAGRELLRRPVGARPQDMAVRIGQHRVAVDDFGQGITPGELCGHARHGVGGGQCVAGVEETDEVGRAHFLQAFVHGVVETAVGFGADMDPAFGVGFFHLFRSGQRAVGGRPVHNPVFDMRIGLFADAPHRALDQGFGLVADRDEMNRERHAAVGF